MQQRKLLCYHLWRFLIVYLFVASASVWANAYSIDFPGNTAYLSYPGPAKAKVDTKFSIQDEQVKEALNLHEVINHSYLTEKDEQWLTLWEDLLAEHLQVLFTAQLTMHEHLVATGIFLDERVRHQLSKPSPESGLALGAEGCGAELPFNRVLARYGEALAANDTAGQNAVLSEIHSTITCMSRWHLAAYSKALGQALIDWQEESQAVQRTLSEAEYLNLREAFVAPTLMVFEAIRYHDTDALVELVSTDFEGVR